MVPVLSADWETSPPTPASAFAMSDTRLHRTGRARPLPVDGLSPGREFAWRWARRAVLVGTALLWAGLLWSPEPTLTLFWSVLIPVLPAVFLVSPGAWRNVCPLATVGMGSADGVVPRWWRSSAPLVGMALLCVLVPARRLLFNTHGAALALLIAVVLGLAWALGHVFPRKSGFCNGLCPVLPVERLYGQRPVRPAPNVRCADCSACAPVGCLDLQPEKATAQLLGPARKGGRWTTTAFGAFAAAFPGLVLGYFLTTDSTWAARMDTFGTVWAAAALSWLVTTAIVRLTGMPGRIALPLLAAAAASVYYWSSLPDTMRVLGLASGTGAARVAMGICLVLWAIRALRSPGPSPTRLSGRPKAPRRTVR